MLERGMSFVGAPGAVALAVRDFDEHHVLAVWRNVAFALWLRETQLVAVSAMGRLLGELTHDGKRAALLQVAETGAAVPSTAVREAISALLKAHTDSLLASAVVFEGEGFRAAGARAVVSGIALVSRLRYPHEIFATVSAALAWIDQRQPQPGSYRRDELERAIEQLRASAR